MEVLLHTRAGVLVCVLCGAAAFHTSAHLCPLRIVWSGIAPDSLQQMSCEFCVVHLRSICHNPALVWSAGAPHVGFRRVFVACVERYCSTRAVVSSYASRVERPLSALSFLRARCVLCGAVLLQTAFSRCPVSFVWCISAPYVIIRHLCGAPVLHMLGSGGCLRPVWSDIDELDIVAKYLGFPNAYALNDMARAFVETRDKLSA